MADIGFLHLGITVSDIDEMTAFYEKYFHLETKANVRFDEAFIRDSPTLYRQPEGVCSDMRMLQSEDGKLTIELFQFSNVEASEPYQWHKTGYHHLAFGVENVPEMYERMKADGVEFFFPPKMRGDSGAHWIFFKDPDGNMVELQD